MAPDVRASVHYSPIGRKLDTVACSCYSGSNSVADENRASDHKGPQMSKNNLQDNDPDTSWADNPVGGVQ